MKICAKCKETKASSDFCIRKRNTDGLHEWCKPCQKKAIQEWRSKNKLHIKVSGRKWRNDNRDKVIRKKRIWRKRNPEKSREIVRKSLKKNGHKYKYAKWRYWLKKKYGITEEQFNEKREQQNGMCAICKGFQACGNIKTLYVDHCHITKVFRGLLCFKCNVMLGAADDKTSTLMEAVAYLERYLPSPYIREDLTPEIVAGMKAQAQKVEVLERQLVLL